MKHACVNGAIPLSRCETTLKKRVKYVMGKHRCDTRPAAFKAGLPHEGPEDPSVLFCTPWHHRLKAVLGIRDCQSIKLQHCCGLSTTVSAKLYCRRYTSA